MGPSATEDTLPVSEAVVAVCAKDGAWLKAIANAATDHPINRIDGMRFSRVVNRPSPLGGLTAI
jgi:hypothetical protein